MDLSDDTIYGLDFGPVLCDALMLRINKNWVELERALTTGKWFAYRFLHPVQATYVYAHEFAKAYRRYFRTYVDRNRADHVTIFKDGDFFNRTNAVSGIWRGRMVADAAGMPYDVYLDLAFDIALRYWKQDRLPHPQQLYSDLITDRIGALWEDRQQGFLYFSEHPNYHNDFYRGLSAQDDHHEWLMAQAAKRGDAARILNRFVFDKKLLPIEKVKARFGEDFAEHVQAIST